MPRKLNESKAKVGSRADWHTGAIPIKDRTAGKVRVRVDERTEIYCTPGTEEETVARFLRNQARKPQ